ncbi:MAG: methylisocitrate lyase [Bacteroidota bacterium]|jgi:methylisocitrate lyase|nr:methylisocitrate lyase [Bacteroidota bacterium]|tara:strand:+ start:1281 stop:2156 length:876 start_codon:yes stop_codon:yes gene_type:complete
MRGRLFRQLVENDKEPLSIFGTVNAYSSVLAKNNGVKSIYLSGSGVAAASFGLPDLGFTKLEDVVEDARRITSACDLPLLVDVDTGFGSLNSIQKTVKMMEKENVAAIHIEDQVDLKRCGHRPNKKLVSITEMQDRIKAAVDARIDDDFVIMARSDALAVENEEMLLERINSYIEVGADMIFPEALVSLDGYKKIAQESSVPILANITEFGKTPLFSKKELHDAGVSMVLYPLTAFRAMSKAAEKIYKELSSSESQENMLGEMQTRDELYDYLSYHKYEKEMDDILNKKDE